MKKRTKYQIFSFVALHASLGSAWLPMLKRVCNPVPSCHSCALAWFACPIGAMLAPLNLISAGTVRTPRETCLICQKCDTACGMDLNPAEPLGANLPANRALECIVCHDCQGACEDVTAIVLAAKTRRKNSERRKHNIPVGKNKRSPGDRREKQTEPPWPG